MDAQGSALEEHAHLLLRLWRGSRLSESRGRSWRDGPDRIGTSDFGLPANIGAGIIIQLRANASGEPLIAFDLLWSALGAICGYTQLLRTWESHVCKDIIDPPGEDFWRRRACRELRVPPADYRPEDRRLLSATGERHGIAQSIVTLICMPSRGTERANACTPNCAHSP